MGDECGVEIAERSACRDSRIHVLHQARPEDAGHMYGTTCHDQIGGTGGLSGEAVRGRWRERGWGEPERSLTRATLEAEAALPPAPFHSHKAGFVSIYLLGFSAKMLLEKHIALI